MFIEDDLDNDRQVAIQSMLNEAMGRAGKSLALVIDNEVDVSPPSTHWVNRNNLKATLAKVELPENAIVIRQSFRGHLRGEIIILLEQGSKHAMLGKLFGYPEQMSPLNLQELTLELANILSGACISGLSDQLKIQLNFGTPSLLSKRGSVSKLLSGKDLKWTDALFLDVGYNVTSMAMRTHLILCMTEEDSHELYKLIDLRLEDQG